jgi:hypothetical protein
MAGKPTDAGAAERSWNMAEPAVHRVGCTAEDGAPHLGEASPVRTFNSPGCASKTGDYEAV